MGYRSDVAIVLSKSGFDKFFELINDQDMINSILKLKLATQQIDLLDKDAKCTVEDIHRLINSTDTEYFHDETGSSIMYWQSIKWYDMAYPTVICIQWCLEQLDESEYLEYISGEDYTDFESHGSFVANPFELHLYKQICFFIPELY